MEMFVPNVSCVVVLNHVLKQELWPFKHPRDFSSRAYFSLRMMKIPSVTILLPLSASNLSLAEIGFLHRTQTNRIKW